MGTKIYLFGGFYWLAITDYQSASRTWTCWFLIVFLFLVHYDLQIILEDLSSNLGKPDEPFTFSVSGEAPAMILVEKVINKHTLIQSRLFILTISLGDWKFSDHDLLLVGISSLTV